MSIDYETADICWSKLFDMALTYGWTPDLSALYTSHHVVSAEDARSLAEALERALPAIPDEDVREPEWDHDPIGWFYDVDPEPWFSGPRKELVRQVIVRCREGALVIGCPDEDDGKDVPFDEV